MLVGALLVGALSVGALLVGALLVGALLVGALLVGALLVGALLVGALSVGALSVGALSVGALSVGALSVGALLVGVLLVGVRGTMRDVNYIKWTPLLQTSELWTRRGHMSLEPILHYNKPQYIFNPQNEDTSIIRTVFPGPKVSRIEGFTVAELRTVAWGGTRCDSKVPIYALYGGLGEPVAPCRSTLNLPAPHSPIVLKTNLSC